MAFCKKCDARLPAGTPRCPHDDEVVFPEPEEHVGDYRIERLLGRGAMGEVFLATDTVLGRPAALKFLMPPSWDLPPETRAEIEQRAEERFQREGQSLARLRHDNVVQVYKAGQIGDGARFVAMELVRGKTLDHLLREKPKDVFRIARRLAEVCDGLAAVHELVPMLVHRDVKPANIIVQPIDPDGERALLVDFGVARVVGEPSQSVALGPGFVGTPQYGAPEQWKGEAVDRSDVYAVGVILYEALSGKNPFALDGPWAAGLAHRTTLPPLPAVPEEQKPLALLALRMLAKAPARRPSAAQAAEAIRTCLDGTAPDLKPIPPRAAPRWPWVLAAVSVGAGALVLFCQDEPRDFHAAGNAPDARPRDVGPRDLDPPDAGIGESGPPDADRPARFALRLPGSDQTVWVRIAGEYVVLEDELLTGHAAFADEDMLRLTAGTEIRACGGEPLRDERALVRCLVAAIRPPGRRLATTTLTLRRSASLPFEDRILEVSR